MLITATHVFVSRPVSAYYRDEPRMGMSRHAAARSGVAREVRGMWAAPGGETGENCIHVQIQTKFHMCNTNKALQPARTYRRHGRL